MEINILYEDKHLLVCQKPAGLPVQSAGIMAKDMVSILKNHRKEKGEEPWIGVVHRLDQPVQGVLVFAKTKTAAADLSRQVNDGRMKKQYLAVVCGRPEQKEGSLVDYLRKNGKTNTSAVVQKGTPEAKRSELKYRILKETEDYALAEIDLLTGRHHQIRVQMSHAGMPLAGDRKYNTGDGAFAAPVVALAAYRLVFFHPVSGKEMQFCTEPRGELWERVK